VTTLVVTTWGASVVAPCELYDSPEKQSQLLDKIN
jgi:hypothetical protein